MAMKTANASKYVNIFVKVPSVCINIDGTLPNSSISLLNILIGNSKNQTIYKDNIGKINEINAIIIEQTRTIENKGERMMLNKGENNENSPKVKITIGVVNIKASVLTLKLS